MVNVDPWYNTEETVKGHLNYMSIALLGACNMKCIFCYVDGDRAGILTPKKLKPIFKEAYGLGMRKIQLSGGNTRKQNIHVYIIGWRTFNLSLFGTGFR